MNVATALNRKYLLYTGVMLTSLCENNPCHIDVYILHSELTDKDIQRLKDCLDKYDVTIYLLYIEKDKFAGRMYTDNMEYRSILQVNAFRCVTTKCKKNVLF